MRMWMVPPKYLCTKHLSGEHVELHMLAAHLRRGWRVDGFVRENCLEPRSIEKRHAALAREMARRGWRHASPLEQPPVAPHQRPGARVDRAAALRELLRRCPACRALERRARAAATVPRGRRVRRDGFRKLKTKDLGSLKIVRK